MINEKPRFVEAPCVRCKGRGRLVMWTMPNPERPANRVETKCPSAGCVNGKVRVQV